MPKTYKIFSYLDDDLMVVIDPPELEPSNMRTGDRKSDKGEILDYEESNYIPSGLSEKSFHKYDRLLRHEPLKIITTNNDDVTESLSIPPTTEKRQIDEVKTTAIPHIPESLQADQDYYDILVDVDEIVTEQPVILSVFFNHVINFLSWLMPTYNL